MGEGRGKMEEGSKDRRKLQGAGCRVKDRDGRWEREEGSKDRRKLQGAGCRVQDRDGPSATTPEDRRWKRGEGRGRGASCR
jgi:hypothetical protein